jgi:hypothetical protein
METALLFIISRIVFPRDLSLWKLLFWAINLYELSNSKISLCKFWFPDLALEILFVIPRDISSRINQILWLQ